MIPRCEKDTFKVEVHWLLANEHKSMIYMQLPA